MCRGGLRSAAWTLSNGPQSWKWGNLMPHRTNWDSLSIEQHKYEKKSDMGEALGPQTTSKLKSNLLRL